jgi:6-phosphogluconolactonase
VASAEVVVESVPALARILAERVEGSARRALGERGRFSLVVSGGSVAEAFLPVLAGADLEWMKVDVFFGDERAVAPDHPDSNYRLAREILLSRVRPRVHRMEGEAPDPAAAAADYEREMRAALGESPKLHLVLLGMGPDGHVCSLFPGHRALDERSRWVTAVGDAPKPPPARITLTLPALALAQTLVVAAFGEAKADAVRQALRDPRSTLPVALAARQASRVVFLLDEGAARGLA